ncbi:MAG: hypothetical protein PHS09_05265 [Candidatus Omnitrophica bacterium]|nr:hypothetical protein [Candidatus Omnitrophota bacterium]MDD5512725.1 hypothetical protein [Candidatus Omnitrophota bacterium]
MQDRELINRIKRFKSEHGYTLYELSGLINIQITTLERWFRTGRINKLYAQVVKQKLGI